MPLYEYELCEGDCAVCGGKFTLRRPLDAKELTHCPACKKPVRKVISSFNSPKTLSISDAKKAGFTVLKHFTGSDGANPIAGLTLSGSTLYGTTWTGGDSGAGLRRRAHPAGNRRLRRGKQRLRGDVLRAGVGLGHAAARGDGHRHPGAAPGRGAPAPARPGRPGPAARRRRRPAPRPRSRRC